MATATFLRRVGTRAAAVSAALAVILAMLVPSPASAQADPQVLTIEQLLLNQRYDPGSVDGVFDQDTAYGLTAFQKIQGLPPTGQPTAETLAALQTSPPPPPALVPGGGATRVEIDLTRQVLFLYQADALVKILPVSTGNGKRFCSGGRCRRAITPTGAFAVYRQGRGWERGPLGSLYNPGYFAGGVAIHGSKSVPAQPASHGCVRIPMSAAEWFPQHAPVGTPVYVLGVGPA